MICIIACSLPSSLFCAPFQKLTHSPQDKSLAVKIGHDQILCYTPHLDQEEILLQNCNKETPLARYDVFSRVAWYINNAWFCMSIGDLSDSSAKITLRPCVLNDHKQQFIVKNNIFFTSDFAMQIKSTQDNKLIATTYDDAQYTKHMLYDMHKWLNTIAAPAGINISSFIAWEKSNKALKDTNIYYIHSNQSSQDALVELIYNPETLQIAEFDKTTKKLICLTSMQTKEQEWNWVKYNECALSNSAEFSRQQWRFHAFADNNMAVLKDYANNFLRLTKNGMHWGVPYTSSQKYRSKDKINEPTSLFMFSDDMQDWHRFINANLGRQLQNCPADNSSQTNFKNAQVANRALIKHFQALNEHDSTANVPYSSPLLIAHFTLSNAWKRRLWQIASSTDGVFQKSGDCAICLLHTYQIIAELINNPQKPLDSGGYFFDTKQGTNPFLSFYARYPLLAHQLEAYSIANDLIAQTWRERIYAAQIYRAITLNMLPQYFFSINGYARTSQQAQSILSQLFNAPIGSIWIVGVYIRNAQGQGSGYALPAIALNNGVLFIPTNTTRLSSFEEYDKYLLSSFASNINDVKRILSFNGMQTIYMVLTMQLQSSYINAFNEAFSVHDCKGNKNRKGSGALPLSIDINQCIQGRCLLP